MEGAFGTRADGVGAYRQFNILYFLHSIFSNISTTIYIKTCSMTPTAGAWGAAPGIKFIL